MDSYQRLFDVIAIENLQMRIEHWVLTRVLVTAILGQIAAILVAFGLGYLVSWRVETRLQRLMAGLGPSRPVAKMALEAAIQVSFPLAALILVTAAASAAASVGAPVALLGTMAKLLVAWIAIRLASDLILNRFLSRVLAIIVFCIVTLNILGVLEATIIRLDHIGFRLGSVHLTVLDILRGMVELIVLLWIALFVSRLLERQVQRVEGLTPSLRVITGKMLRFVLVALALTAALTSTGIDLTAFALFTGALGVGIGFGMQKTISNLICGLLLLFDRSIKPGDVLELSNPSDRSVQLFGWVTSLRARYVSLTTRDGTEWLVPNEELISQRIVNWSYTHRRLRLLMPIGVSFDCDVPLAMQIAVEAARATPRVLLDPPPVCRLMSFGDSSVNLEMRFWIDDPVNGIVNVRSDVLLAIWRRFRENGIRTPLGHRDLFLKKDSELTVTLVPRGRTGSA